MDKARGGEKHAFSFFLNLFCQFASLGFVAELCSCFCFFFFSPVVVDFERVRKLTQGSSEGAEMFAKATKSTEVNNLAGRAESSFREREREGQTSGSIMSSGN